MLPTLIEAGCDFKVIADAASLRDLNAGVYGGGAIGKAMTIYPSQDSVREIGMQLAHLLEGFEAPDINSDRRVRPRAPVYYRFGPIVPRLRISDTGQIDVALEAPDGQLVSGRAWQHFVQPSWTEDPFGETATRGVRLPRHDGAPVIGDHYRITGVIARTHRGASYRAVDVRTGTAVVVKEARAFVNETSTGDTRDYLRNECRVLTILEGLPGIPHVIDHFSYGADEFLVTDDLGRANLRDDIVDHGVFVMDAARPRNLWELARALLQSLDAIHEIGVIYRDLAPKNVIVRDDRGWGLIDFELSRFECIQRYGFTAGYSHPRQRRNERGSIGDDYYSLGMTLFHAVTGLDPVIIDADPETNLARTLSCLDAVCCTGAPAAAVIRGLLDEDPATQIDTVRRLREADPPSIRRRAAKLRRPPLASIVHHTLAAVIGHANAICAGDLYEHQLPTTTAPYAGTAGIVMELVHHPAAHATAGALARTIACIAGSVESQSGLLFGRMGIALALQAAADVTGDAELRRAAEAVIPRAEVVETESRVDISHGLAGLGVGYLAFAAAALDPRPWNALAARCAARLCDGGAMIAARLDELPVGNPAHGISVADGFAHGRAGIAYFLLACAAESGDQACRREARSLVDHLALLAPQLAVRAGTRLARPMSASWCQGLAGIGTTLVHAARLFGDDGLLAAARTAAGGCLAIAPRVPLVTQCCGLAGTGEFLLDLAVATGDLRYRNQAMEVLSLMLLRSGGRRSAPKFPDTSMATETPGWATGASGVLSFLRRLVDPPSRRLWMADKTLALSG